MTILVTIQAQLVVGEEQVMGSEGQWNENVR